MRNKNQAVRVGFNIEETVLSVNLHPDTQFRYYLYPVKRFILILLISIYTTATVGVGVRSFYCCNKLQSVNIVFTNATKEKCGMANATGSCCKFKYQFFKVKDSHVAFEEISSPAKYFAHLPIFFPSFQVTIFAPTQISAAHRSHAPPIHSGTPLYLFNCIYRI